MSDDVILSDEDMQETLDRLNDEERETEIEDVEIEDDPEEDIKEPEEGELEEEVEEEPEEPSDEELEEIEAEEEADDYITPPSTWTAEAKSQWRGIPARIRQEILKREEDIGRGISSYKQRAEAGDKFNQVLNPYLPMIQASGAQPEQVVQSLLNTAYRLRTGSPQEKAQLLLQTAQQYGADLEVMRQEPDPQQAQLQNYLSPLQQEISQLREQLNNQSQQSQQAGLAEVHSKIEAFRNATDESGNPSYPYFDNLRGQMAALIEARDAEIQSQISTHGFSNLNPMSLEEAYDAAQWANSETRSLLTASQQEQSELERKRQAREKARKAKAIDKTNVKSKPARKGNKAKPVGSVEDTMRETLKEIQSRAN